jgi:hypothetical protein
MKDSKEVIFASTRQLCQQFEAHGSGFLRLAFVVFAPFKFLGTSKQFVGFGEKTLMPQLIDQIVAKK